MVRVTLNGVFRAVDCDGNMPSRRFERPVPVRIAIGPHHPMNASPAAGMASEASLLAGPGNKLINRRAYGCV